MPLKKTSILLNDKGGFAFFLRSGFLPLAARFCFFFGVFIGPLLAKVVFCLQLSSFSCFFIFAFFLYGEPKFFCLVGLVAGYPPGFAGFLVGVYVCVRRTLFVTFDGVF